MDTKRLSLPRRYLYLTSDQPPYPRLSLGSGVIQLSQQTSYLRKLQLTPCMDIISLAGVIYLTDRYLYYSSKIHLPVTVNASVINPLFDIRAA